MALGCPARVRCEAERGRRVLVLALFEPVGSETPAAQAVRELGADYVAAGLPAARDRRARLAPSTRVSERGPEDEDVVLEAARLLTETGPRTQAVHVYAPLGLGASVDHLLTYEAAVRAFATEAGRNLFLYEERPEAFVPGAVRTRLALLGARLPPGAARSPERAGLLRHLWRVNEPARLRGDEEGFGARLRAIDRRPAGAFGWPGPGTRCAPSARGCSRSSTPPTRTRGTARRRSSRRSCRRTPRVAREPPGGSTPARPRRRRSSAVSTTPSGSGSSFPRETACPRSSTRWR